MDKYASIRKALNPKVCNVNNEWSKYILVDIMASFVECGVDFTMDDVHSVYGTIAPSYITGDDKFDAAVLYAIEMMDVDGVDFDIVDGVLQRATVGPYTICDTVVPKQLYDVFAGCEYRPHKVNTATLATDTVVEVELVGGGVLLCMFNDNGECRSVIWYEGDGSATLVTLEEVSSYLNSLPVTKQTPTDEEYIKDVIQAHLPNHAIRNFTCSFDGVVATVHFNVHGLVVDVVVDVTTLHLQVPATIRGYVGANTYNMVFDEYEHFVITLIGLCGEDEDDEEPTEYIIQSDVVASSGFCVGDTVAMVHDQDRYILVQHATGQYTVANDGTIDLTSCEWDLSSVKVQTPYKQSCIELA